MNITMKNKAIRSLDELRDHFDLAELSKLFLDGSLQQWLSDSYYDRQADAVQTLRRELGMMAKKGGADKKTSGDPFADIASIFCCSKNTDSIERSVAQQEQQALTPLFARRLCAILGVEYAKYVPEAERTEYERRLATLRKHTDDPALLACALETATNQSELAALLDEGCKRIILCGGSFTVPIRVSGVHYTGLGEPKMEAPYTEEQYRRAGVTFENIELPREINESCVTDAKLAAARNGYDDFYEQHTHFATIVHQRLKCGRLYMPRCDLNSETDGADCEFYKWKSQAEGEMRRVINAAYDKAAAYFAQGSDVCIADVAAKEYAERIGEQMMPLLNAVSEYAGERAKKLRRLVESAEDALQKGLAQELKDSYYKLYNRSYFLDKPEVEDLMGDVEVSDSILLNGIYKMLQRDDDYVISGLTETISELEDDVNTRVDTFCSSAHQCYLEYCGKLETIAEEIGQKLSDEDLKKVEMLENREHQAS